MTVPTSILYALTTYRTTVKRRCIRAGTRLYPSSSGPITYLAKLCKPISTHVIPAANLRVTPGEVPVPKLPHHSLKRADGDIKKLGLELIVIDEIWSYGSVRHGDQTESQCRTLLQRLLGLAGSHTIPGCGYLGRAPDMLQLYVDFGLHEDGSGHIGLKHLPSTRRSSLPTREPATKLDGKARTSSCFELFLGFAARIFKAGRYIITLRNVI
ncbi:uncharacterized protein F5147DRAFT_648882 [Suillus discolor]|uniref:Uncharacterized protein n=1 Tax=Suillus discolor TaxID=1912936 RepID=A0A9P7FG20_9AGAM|nr:uncharacterized protein F5147DRAFT_648882 [Suillus discolor]KAG2117340.1 hypothetical protein F5147DRAFT_648882 [Suillus discolor]